jgi:hypothetical protein
MKRLTVLCGVIVAAVLAAATLAPASPAATSEPTTFTDPTGDAGTAPDITTVKVSNDDVGQFSFDVAFATPYGADAIFGLYLDTDMNESTGNPRELGADYLLYDDHASHTLSLMQWNGTDWADAPSTATVSLYIATDGKSLTLSANRSVLGGTSAFNFVAYAYPSGSSDTFDDAPSGNGSWQYKLKPTILLSLGAAKANAAKAGHPWALAIVVKRSDTGAFVGPEGTIACAGSVGSTKLTAVTHAFISGGSGAGTAAVCAFVLPKSAKHKTAHGTVTVKYSGQTVTHSFSAPVK